MIHLCSLCLVLPQFVTLSINGIEVSPFTPVLISRNLIYIQAASLLSADDRVGVGVPSLTEDTEVESNHRSVFALSLAAGMDQISTHGLRQLQRIICCTAKSNR